GLGLVVIAERPVAEHLEEGVVIGVAADFLEIVVLAGDADALLAVDRPLVRPRARTEEHVLELVHAGVGEHKRGIVERHDARRRHERVAVLQGEEVDELAADVVSGWHLSCPYASPERPPRVRILRTGTARLKRSASK